MQPLGIICPQGSDSTSFYRALGPFTNLFKTEPDFQMIPNIEKISWDVVKMCSGFFMQRPFTPNHIEMAKVIKSNNKPLWVDFDDDLLAVPTDNPTWKIYGKDQTKKAVIDNLSYADVASFSTECLRLKFLSELSKVYPDKKLDTYVIPNAFDHHLFNYEKKPQRDKFMMWRGSETHLRDLITYSKEMIEVANEFPEWTWLFLGQYPWFMIDHVPEGRFLFQDPLDPIKYFELLTQIRPSIFLTCLHPSPFNLGKSSINWQEGTYAGAAVIAPEWPEWTKPGVTTYKTPAEFKSSLISLMLKTPEERDALQAKSWDAVPDIDSVNKIRWEIVNKYFRK